MLQNSFKNWPTPALSRRFVRMAVIGLLLVAATLSSVDWAETPQKVNGFADVRDGDSLVIGRHRIRLVGIDAPERGQACKRQGKSWACGRDAMRHLARLVGNHAVECDVQKRDRFQRLLARCSVGERELNRSMVRDGMAVSFGRSYWREEAMARNKQQGLWAGKFQRPKLWRQQNLNR